MSFLNNLKTVKGNVKIMDLNVDNLGVTNFILENLEIVEKDLIIENNDFLTIQNSFNALQRIEGNFKILLNKKLLNITNAFKFLTVLLGDFIFSYNDNYLAFSDDIFNFINPLSGINNFEISYNSSLKFINENTFKGLGIINGNFIIKNNDNLEKIVASNDIFKSAFPLLSLVKKNFIIENNEKLDTIGSFPVLQTVQGDLKINNNNSLKKLNDNFCQILVNIGGSLYISNNNSLVQIGETFNLLQNIFNDLEINNNNNLSQLATGNTAFPSLLNIYGNLKIYNNEKLEYFIDTLTDGCFPVLTFIEKNLEIYNNKILTSLNFSFNGLVSIKNDLKIYNNDSLKNIGNETFNILQQILNNLEIYDNKELNELSDTFQSLIRINNNLIIKNNNSLSNFGDNSFPLLQFLNNLLSIEENNKLSSIGEQTFNILFGKCNKLIIKKNNNTFTFSDNNFRSLYTSFLTGINVFVDDNETKNNITNKISLDTYIGSKKKPPEDINIELTNVKSEYQGYFSGVLADNGKIYCPPYGMKGDGTANQRNRVLKINPTANPVTFEYVGPEVGNSNQYLKYSRGVKAKNGKIYCPPYGLEPGTDKNTNEILVINPSNDSIEYIELPIVDDRDDYWENKKQKYLGGVLANNNKIYCAPFGSNENFNNTNVILVINTIDDTTEILELPPVNENNNYWVNKEGKYSLGVLANNDKIYYPPCGSNLGGNTNVILVLNPSNPPSFETIELPKVDDKDDYWDLKIYKYLGGVLANNNNINDKIYCAPYGLEVNTETFNLFNLAENTNIILEIDPSNNSIKTLKLSSIDKNDNWDVQIFKYFNGVLANNGKIYFPPYGGDNILNLFPSQPNNTITNTRKVLEIDPTGDTVIIRTSNYIETDKTDKYSGGVLANNNKIYCTPFDFDKLLVIDPS